MPQIQCEACGSTEPGGRSAFPDVGLVCDACFDKGYAKLSPEQKRVNPPREPMRQGLLPSAARPVPGA